MEFRILGPLEVEHDGRLLALGAAKQRAVLAVLLLHANRTVSRDRLIDAVWGDDPPSTAATALQVYVSGLRKTLGAERIETTSPGYRLTTEPESVDLVRFETLLRAGSAALAAGDARGACERLDEALALWRGEPLADLDGAQFLAAERLRLEELRLGAVEERLEAELALGRHAELVAELYALVRAHPLRERLRGQLMLALYRSERQAEALEVYREGRRLLVEELGLEPGHALQRLERAILEQDVALAAPPPAPRSAAPEQPRSFRSSRRLFVLGAATVIVVTIAAALAWTAVRSDSSAVAVRPNSIAVVDPEAARVDANVPLNATPVDVAVGFGSAWVATENGAVLRIDPETKQITHRIDVGTSAHDLAVGFGFVWVANGVEGVVTLIDPGSSTLDKTIAFDADDGATEPVHWIQPGPDAMWALRGRTLVRIADRRVVETYPVPAATAMAVDASAGTVWLVTPDEQLLKFQPSLGSVVRAQNLYVAGAAPTAADAEIHLIAYAGRGEVVRTGGDSEAVETIGPPSPAILLALAVDRSSVWTVDAAGDVVRRDRQTGRVTAEIATAPTVRSALALGEGVVWVAIQEPS